jgi:hypothetical protein
MEKGFSHLGRLSDLTEGDVVAATVSQEECASLLSRLGQLAGPEDGRAVASILLTLFTRLAAVSPWLEGDLAVELFEEDAGTRVRVMNELGGGLRERVLPAVTFRSSVAELSGAIADDLAVDDLLRLEAISSRCVLILASEPMPGSTDFEISQTCLTPGAAPEDVDSGWDA